VAITNLANHVGFVLDESYSMRPHETSLIKVIDAQVAHLARRSQELEQETRVSVWGFADTTICHVWDMDVLRLPSIAKLYRLRGNTALIDATMQAIDDLSEIPERYGDHSFLMYVASDGEENASRLHRPEELRRRIAGLPDNWTLGALVPGINAAHEAKRFGFPAGNVEVWDTTSKQGVEEVGRRIQAATETYMVARSHGVRSTTSLFRMDDAVVNAAAIKAARLTPLARGKYVLNTVPRECVIKDYVEDCGFTYIAGRGFHELVKPEKVGAAKNIAIVSKDGREQVWIGREARQMLGLPDVETRVRPDFNTSYRIMLQSTSVNRKLKPGQKFLYLT
jgi:hypothetical protein